MPDFAPKTTPTLLFFADFQWNMLGHSININNLCRNPLVLKKIGKTSKNCYFWDHLVQKRGQHGSQPKWKTNFFGIITDTKEADYQLLETWNSYSRGHSYIQSSHSFVSNWCNWVGRSSCLTLRFDTWKIKIKLYFLKYTFQF